MCNKTVNTLPLSSGTLCKNALSILSGTSGHTSEKRVGTALHSTLLEALIMCGVKWSTHTYRLLVPSAPWTQAIRTPIAFSYFKMCVKIKKRTKSSYFYLTHIKYSDGNNFHIYMDLSNINKNSDQMILHLLNKRMLTIWQMMLLNTFQLQKTYRLPSKGVNHSKAILFCKYI